MNLQTFIRRPVFTSVIAFALIVFGIYSLPRIGVALLPNVEFPVVTVTTVYPGADAETMERDVSKILEDRLATVSGLDTLQSVSVEGVSQVIAQFKLEKPAGEAAQEVRDKVAAAAGELPRDAKAPIVEKFDINGGSVLELALSGPVPIERLSQIAKDVIKPELQRRDGVGAVDVVGGREREVRIVLDPDRLRAHGLTVSDVAGTVRGQSMTIPAGRTQEGRVERAVRLDSEVRTVEELSALVVQSPGGVPVRLADLGTVVDGPEEERSHATWKGASALTLEIHKQSDANTVAVVQDLRDAMPTITKRLPPGVKMEVISDSSRFIHASIAAVQEDLVLGAVLAVVIVLVFLRNGRSTLIAAVALPTSVVGTVAVMAALGFTFNLITMLALTLSIGLLVDDAIVVIENIVRMIEEGTPPAEAALRGTQQIAVAVLAVTLAILAVFVPVAFMRGVMGRIFYQFGVTVAVAVAISYGVSMLVTPMMSARLLRHDHGKPSLISRIIERGLTAMESGYAAALRVLLRHRGKTILAAVGALVGTLALTPLLKVAFSPSMDQGAIQVAVKLPVGATVERTQRQLADLEAQVRALPGVESVYASAGGGVQGKVNEGTLRVNLVPISKRAETQRQILGHMRKTLVAPPGVTLAYQEIDMMGTAARAVQFVLRSDDWPALTREADKLVATMKKKPGFADVESSVSSGKPQIDIRLDRDRAASLGVSAGAVAQVLRAYLGGDDIADFRQGGSTFKVRIALPDAVRADPVALASLQVRSATGQLVELANVTQSVGSEGPSQIDRKARQRTITVFANLDDSSLGEAMTWLNQYAKAELPPSVSTQSDGDAKQLADSAAAFGSALLLGVVLVYLILSAQFESLLDPLSIMFALPLALIGALGGLILARMEMSMFGMIGIIMLMGLVTKNGILLVEFARQLKEEGKPTYDALVEAGKVRLRPILMTTVAMVAGMIPVAMAHGDGAEMRAPMGVVIIGGLASSTVLTLAVVPAVYSVLDAIRARLSRPRAAQPPLVEAPHGA
ncbi:Cobalt-zinc-cadmium resistance protein CzcA [Minicystis rosea]|nr:Cobalt-zinc-cadmium resistance protein CzcA [Minicystis rosea]